MTPAAATGFRQTADDRREQVLEAAMREFAELGYEAASTAAIARRAGISQPYIYALFPNKQQLFLAVHERVVARIKATFATALRGSQAATPQDALNLMGATYPELIGDRLLLLCQLQAYAAAGEPEIRSHVAREFKGLFDEVARLSGASPREVAEFFAAGMLANVTTILDLPELCEPLWEEKHG